MDNKEKHYFDLKGKEAERITHEISLKTFLSHWCFLNPKLPNGNEICDLLIVCDEVAIIWQIKNIKINENGEYNEKEVKKNLKQLLGAQRQLFGIKTKINLKNNRRNLEEVDLSVIKKIFLISLFSGEAKIAINPFELFKGYPIHVFNGPSLEIIFRELDTISDFTKYLTEREAFFQNNNFRSIIIFGGEEELLGYFLVHRNFPVASDDKTRLVMSDYWEEFSTSSRYLAKKKANEISYFLDSLIDKSRGKNETDDEEKYEIFARKLAKLDRFQRRCVASAFLDARLNAYNGKSFRRLFVNENITYCFLFQDDAKSPGDRYKELVILCWIAKGKFPENEVVIGIATEPHLEKSSTYDFFLLDNFNWTEEDQKSAERMQKELNFFNEPVITRLNQYDFPIEITTEN